MDRKIEKQKWTRKKMITIATGALLVFAGLYEFVFTSQTRKLNQEKNKLTISSVRYGEFKDYIPVTGSVLPIETFYLDVVEGGRVLEKYVDEGAVVKAGQPILRLENAQLTLNTIYNQAQVVQQENNLRSYRLQLDQNRLNLQNQLLQLDLQLLNQERVYKTNKALHEKKMVSDVVFEDSRDQYNFLLKSKALTLESYRLDSISRIEQIKQLEVSVKQFRQNLQVIENQFSNLVVKAPVSGQLTALNAEIGKSLPAGQNIGQIDNTTSYKVKIDIDEHYISRVKEGLQGECTIDGKVYRLEVMRVYVQVTGGKFQADMHFLGDVPANLRRGQTFHIKLDLGGSNKALLIDAGAYTQLTGGQWVFVLDKDGKSAYRKQIKSGRQNPEFIEILGGLKDGEQVIVSAYDDYQETDKIVIK